MVMEHIIIQMEKNTKEIGKMTNAMVMEHIIIQMELNMKEIGKRINNTVKVSRHGLTVPNMRVNMSLERNMEWVSLHGLIRALTSDNSKRTTSRDTANTTGLMVESMKDPG